MLVNSSPLALDTGSGPERKVVESFKEIQWKGRTEEAPEGTDTT